MHRDRGRALCLADAAELQEVLAGVIQAQPELDRQGNRETASDRLNDPPGQLRIPHQRGAGAALQDLIGRTAHVDVADVGSELLDDIGRGRHPFRVGAVDLDRKRALLLREEHLAHLAGVENVAVLPAQQPLVQLPVRLALDIARRILA